MKKIGLQQYKSTNVIEKYLDFQVLAYFMKDDVHPFTKNKKLSDNHNKDCQPTFTPRGTYKRNIRQADNLDEFSGILFYDIDFDEKRNGKLTKESIKSDRTLYNKISKIVQGIKQIVAVVNDNDNIFCLVKTSFSGLGLHLFIDIGEDTPQEDILFWYNFFAENINERLIPAINESYPYNFKLDNAVNSNACQAIISYDPDLFFNPDYTVDRSLFQPFLDEFVKQSKVNSSRIETLLLNHKIDGDDQYEFTRLLKHINDANIITDYENRKVFQYLYFYLFDYNNDWEHYKSVMWDLYEPSQRVSSENYQAKMKRDFVSFYKNIQQKLQHNSLYTNVGILYDLMSKYGLQKAESEVIIEIESKLSEKQKEVFSFFDSHSKILLEADTGVGKTFITISYLKKQAKKNPDKNYILCVPTTVQVEQICKEYSDHEFNIIPQCSTFYKPLDYTPGVYNNVRVTTYESAEKIDNVEILVMDEAHHFVKSFDFRSDGLLKLDEIITTMFSNRSSKVIFLTATPDSMLLDYHKLLVKSTVNKKLSMDVVWSRNKKDKLFDVVEHRDTTKRIMYVILNMRIQQQLKDKFGLTDVINSQYKDTELLRGIINTSFIMSGCTALSASNLIAEGINILNEQWDEIVFYDIIDVDTIRQFTARFRKADPHITLIMGYPVGEDAEKVKKQKAMFSREYVYRLKLLEAQEICEKLNHTKTRDIEIFVTDNSLDNSYEYCYYKEKEQKWVPNEWRLKKDIDDIYFHALYKRPEMFVNKLKYYYEVVRVISDNNIARGDTAYEFQDMVDLKGFVTLNKYMLLEVKQRHPLTGSFKTFFDDNKNIILLQQVQHWITRLEKMKELNLDLDADIEKIFEPTRDFNNYIKKVQYRQLAGTTDYENGKRQLSGDKIHLVLHYLKRSTRHVYKDALESVNQILLESGNIPFAVCHHKNGDIFSTAFTQFLNRFDNIEVRTVTTNGEREKYIFYRNPSNT